MVIDILVAICVIWAFVIGLRRGLVVQLCHLIGLYIAILIAPNHASTVGAHLFDDPVKGYIAGFALIVVVAMLLIWIVAPLLRFVIVWKPIRPIDTLLGGLLNIITVVVVIAILFSIFDRMNISDGIRQDRLVELMKEYEGREQELSEIIREMDSSNPRSEVRACLNHRYVEYETLSNSICFFPLVDLGIELVPAIKELDNEIKEHCADTVERLISEEFIPSAKEFNEDVKREIERLRTERE